jgi:hypothetical protein
MWYMYTDTKSPYIMPQLEVKKLLMSFLYTDRQRQLLMDIQSSGIYKRHFCSHASHAGLPRGEVPRRGLVLDLQSRSIAQMLTSSVPELEKIEVDLKLDGLDNQKEEEGRNVEGTKHGNPWGCGAHRLRLFPVSALSRRHNVQFLPSSLCTPLRGR